MGKITDHAELIDGYVEGEPAFLTNCLLRPQMYGTGQCFLTSGFGARDTFVQLVENIVVIVQMCTWHRMGLDGVRPDLRKYLSHGGGSMDHSNRNGAG